ncbi:MAG TPA: hypothetical protein VF149_00725 [Bacillales bacterium]
MKRRRPKSIPHSSFFGRWRIGEDFFERYHLHRNNHSPRGLVDDFSVYQREDFQPNQLHPEVIAFYEDTLRYELYADVHWLGMFRFLSPIYKWFSKRIGQINLPLNDKKNQGQMFSRILPLNSAKDGRTGVRAWIRTNDKQETIFVAAYSLHIHRNETYMNIALPLPLGNMTGVLRLDHLESDGDVKKGLQLTSLPRQNFRGDEGIYYHTKWFSVCLPIQERFLVWYTNEQEVLRAAHKMWMFGVPFLTIDYVISKKQG